MESQELLHLDDMDSHIFEPGAFGNRQEGDPIENETFFQAELCCSTLCNAEDPDVLHPVATTEETPTLLFTPFQVNGVSQQQVHQWRKSKREYEETSQPAGYTTTTTTATTTTSNTTGIATTTTATATTITTGTLAGKTGRWRSRQISASVAGGAAAVSDFCSDMGWGAPGDSPVSSVECNTEDDGEDFEEELTNAKKRASEDVRERHLFSAEIGSRFCHSSAMSRFKRECFASAASIFSPPRPMGTVGMRDNEEKEKEKEEEEEEEEEKKKYSEMYSQQRVPQSSSTCRRDGNTALNFTSNDVSIVRAFAMSLLEEEEKKKRNRQHQREQLEEEEEELDDYLSYM